MTLTELLVALAIVSLIGVALTVGVNSAVKVHRDSTRLYEAETLCGTILTYLEDEFRFSRNIQNQPAGSEPAVTFDSQVFGQNVGVIVDDGKVLIGKDPGSGFALLGNSAYTSGLKVSECKVEYNESSGLVTIQISVGPDSTDAYVKHEVTVAPVDN